MGFISLVHFFPEPNLLSCLFASSLVFGAGSLAIDGANEVGSFGSLGIFLFIGNGSMFRS